MNKLKPPVIISFMGVDGSGKTTLAKKINKIFKKSRYLHLKPYILFKDRRTTVKNPHIYKKNIFFISLIRLISWLVSYKFFFFKHKNTKLYIFDRYAHDILIDPLRYRHSISKNLTKLILNFFPQPNIWIFTSASFKIIKSRKLELSNKELSRQMKDYSIFFKNKKNVIRLNTCLSDKILIKILIKKIKYLLN